MNNKSSEAEVANENLVEWHTFVAGLLWKRGFLDSSSFSAAMEGASLNIPPEIAQAEIERRIERAGDCPNIRKSKGISGSVHKSRVCPMASKRIALRPRFDGKA